MQEIQQTGRFWPKTYIGLVNKPGRIWQKREPNPTKMLIFKFAYVWLTAYLRLNTMTEQLHSDKKENTRSNQQNSKKLT